MEKLEAEPQRLATKTVYKVIFIMILTTTAKRENVRLAGDL